MMKHAEVIRVPLMVLALVVMMLAFAACAQQSTGSSSASASGTASTPGTASASGASASSSQATSGGEDVVSIGLEYNAGTGYEWQCAMDPEGVVSLVGQETENLASDKQMSGGPLREVFTFRAEKPGEVVLTFKLVRSWEGEPAETQVYAFTVTDDKKMILNPYKSDFSSEPEWGSNS